MTFENPWTIWVAIATVVYIGGTVAALFAVKEARTPQGATAWVMGLVAFPFIAFPLYLIFGRRRFEGYVNARRSGDREIRHIGERVMDEVNLFRAESQDIKDFLVLERLAHLPFTEHNSAQLFTTGKDTFDAIFEAVESAKSYILIQFFIYRNDTLGTALAARLKIKAMQGVKVYFMFDEIGSSHLPSSFIDELTKAGIEVHPFNTASKLRNRLQINFRNHRKIVLVDGHMAFVGGYNVGDEYLGKNPKLGPWRDTHMRLTGPSVLAVQLSFLEDWHWATGETPKLFWHANAASNNGMNGLVLAMGPADYRETCALFFLHCIQSAKHRIWIASPYFVPDQDVMSALKLAALRGVDVRILLPSRADHLLVYMTAFSYIDEAEESGIQFYRYLDGFMHQKTVLIDNRAAAIGTANLDNRSFRLNFEMMFFFPDREFAEKVGTMLHHDFMKSRRATSEELAAKPFLFRLFVPVAKLFSPIL
ncbi:cardiolipin synthase [Desulfovibrio inopinatus]|uniref:cardiolipin synthase n=1 Tax=Desulfovibrio inopinatus TaxID=102109 RepID=UPI00041199AA|nr:cardiolipin synthase [Desulfovibrio inopinatus]